MGFGFWVLGNPAAVYFEGIKSSSIPFNPEEMGDCSFVFRGPLNSSEVPCRVWSFRVLGLGVIGWDATSTSGDGEGDGEEGAPPEALV